MNNDDIMDLKARVEELEGYVSGTTRHEQRHLDPGTQEREYWHYGYLMALKDVLRRIEST